MRLSEILLEDVSYQDAIKNITDVLTVQFPALYVKLKVMAEQLAKNHDPRKQTFDKVCNFTLGGQKSKWYKEVYFSFLKPSLYTLAKHLPKAERQDLVDYLSNDTENNSFKNIEYQLIQILKRAAMVTNNDKFKNAVQIAQRSVADFYAHMAKMDKIAYDDGNDDEPETPKAPNIIGQQNAEAERIINDVLSRVDRRQAGEIRNIVARSENKLITLQQELNRRRIQV